MNQFMLHIRFREAQQQSRSDDTAIPILWEFLGPDAQPAKYTSKFIPPYKHSARSLIIRALNESQKSQTEQAKADPHMYSDEERAILKEHDLVDEGGMFCRDAYRIIGWALYKSLIADRQAATTLSTALHTTARTENSVLHVRLHFAPGSALLELPWELLHNEQGPLLFQNRGLLTIARHLDLPYITPRRISQPGPKRLLAVKVQHSLSKILYDDETRARELPLKPLLEEHRLAMEVLSPAKRIEFGQKVTNYQPHILHYFGHGEFKEGRGQLKLDDGPLAEQALLKIGIQPDLQWVILVSCESAMTKQRNDFRLVSGVATTLSAQGVPVVLGIQLNIRTNIGVRLVYLLYRALANGLSIEMALAHVQRDLFFEEPDAVSWYVPVLYLQDGAPTTLI